MVANPTANGRQRIFPTDLQIRIEEPPLADVIQVNGHIHPGGTAILTGGEEQGGANRRRTALLLDVGFVFIPEVADGAKDRVGSRLAEAAKGRLFDAFPKLKEEIDVPFLSFAVADALQDLQHPLGADAARGAFPARLILDKIEEEFGQVHHTGVFIDDD